SASARSFFRREFSPSSSFRRFASLAFMPPYWATQRCHVESAISRCLQTSSRSVPAPRSLWPSASFRMIWSGVCRRRLMVSVLLPHLGATDSHTTWTTTRGSPHKVGDDRLANATDVEGPLHPLLDGCASPRVGLLRWPHR